MSDNWPGHYRFSALAEKVGRIRGTTAAIAIMSIMSFGCAMAGNFPALLACRLVQGIGVGGEMPVAATYINELSRAHGRGRFFLLYEMIFPLGLHGHGTDRRVARAGLWMEIYFSPRRNSRIADHFSRGAPSRIAEMADLQGPVREAEAIVEQIEASTDRRVPARGNFSAPLRRQA